MSDEHEHPEPAESENDARESARIEAYLRGDPAAYREIESWIGVEIRRSYHALKREHEDMIQTVHGIVFDNLKSCRFQRRSSLRSYVTGIVHRMAIARLRHLYRDRVVAETDLETVEDSRGTHPYERLEAMDEQRQLNQVLLQMPESCRKLWKMVVVDRLAYDEIARRLSVPVGTIKSRMWYCRRRAVALLERLKLRGGGPRRIASRSPA